MKGYQVTEDIHHANKHPHFYEVKLLEGDLIVKSDDDGTWWIEAPGIAIGGFVLTPKQEATLREVEYGKEGLTYWIIEEGSDDTDHHDA